MEVFLDTEGSIDGLEKAIDEAVQSGAESLLVLSCDANGFTPACLDPLLDKVSIPLIGGIFPVILHNADHIDVGSLVVAMESRPDIYCIPDMSDPDVDFEDVLDRMVEDDITPRTLMVLVDGLSTRIAAFIDALYLVFGLELNYVGGGAGSLTLVRRPCVFTNEGLREDCALLGAFPVESGVGVSHGWSSVSGPYKVTEAERNVVKSLDWEQAFDVYKKVVEGHSGEKFVAVPFMQLAKAYPFGIAKMGTERVVRDALTLDGDRNLICVGEVPEGAYVDILHGEKDALIDAAGRALERARNNFPAHATPRLGLLMDCVSRMLFLEEGFQEELMAMIDGGLEFVGACSIGEIANSGKDYLEFYNKTAVVAFLEGQ